MKQIHLTLSDEKAEELKVDARAIGLSVAAYLKRLTDIYRVSIGLEPKGLSVTPPKELESTPCSKCGTVGGRLKEVWEDGVSFFICQDCRP